MSGQRKGKDEGEVSLAYRLGVRGEDLAAEYLRRQGYRVLERRLRIGGIEIDIVAQRGDLLVWVEVKTRSTDFFAAPQQAVDVKKQRRMIAAADLYLRERGLSCEVRFDIISVVANPSRKAICHIEGAFPPFV